MWRTFWRWAWRRPAPFLERLHIVIYTRHGCHLCESAEQLLAAEQGRFRFRLEIVDVDQSPELVASYGESVPVVRVAGKVRFRGVVNPVLLRRLLEAESTRL
jgi:glutaredoxin